jgi:hypothetical protein
MDVTQSISLVGAEIQVPNDIAMEVMTAPGSEHFADY